MTDDQHLNNSGRKRSWLTKFFIACGLLAVIIVGGTVLALRYWFLPNIEYYRENIAQAVSGAVGQRITIGKITADWEGIRPFLALDNVVVFDRAGRPALVLSRVSATLSWRSLTTGEVRLHLLEIEQPNLSILRDSRGIIYVAGVELSQQNTGTGFADWLLKQRHLIVDNATILWEDEKLAAPQLVLKSVTLQIDNGWFHHHFILHATPPPNLAAPLEVKGDFTGSGLEPGDLAKWQGTMFAKFDYADIAAWRTWIPYPIEMQSGTGALNLSLTLKDAHIQQATADVYLSKVKTRLRSDLPEMNLTELRGRLGWKILNGGFELSGTYLSLATEGGISLQPADFTVRLYPKRDQQPFRGEIDANAFDLLPLAVLADRLPLPQDLRQQLVNFSPRGSVYDLALKWSGDLPIPKHYSVKGRFVNLALNPREQWPGFSGISGAVDGNERGGQITLNAKNARVILPTLFEEALKFDSLTVGLGWTVRAGQAQFNLAQAVFSSSELSGNTQGSYIWASRGPGSVDLSASLSRMQGSSLIRYLPRVASKDLRAWLADASVSGALSDVRLRVKGDLADFPFADKSKGLLQVTGKLNGVGLRYSPDWPRLESVNGDLQFNGARLEVRSNQADIWGAKVTKLDAVIPDVNADNAVVQVDGETEAPNEKYLRFLERYSTYPKVRNFVEGVHSEGIVKLEIKLSVPLNKQLENTYAGIFHFNGTQLSFDPDLPPIEQLTGMLHFSGSSWDAQNLQAQILNGPVRIDIATQGADVHISAQGKANADAAAKFTSWAKFLHGSADWRGNVDVTDKLTDFVLESNLQGVTSELPAPLDKAADTSIPVRFERQVPGGTQEQILLSYGKIASMQLALRKEREHRSIDRGVVVFGAAAGAPDKSGIWVSGVLKNFDLDKWSDLFDQLPSTGHIDLAAIDVKFDTLDAFNRRFHDFHVDAKAQDGNWESTLTGKEINGKVIWQPQGKGKLIAHLTNLNIPSAPPEKKEQPAQKAPQKNYPALDVSSKDFVLGDKALGELALQAVPQGQDWTIEDLRLSNPDFVFVANGVWRAWISEPQTQVKVKLDVTDIGNLLARLKLPPGIKGGKATLVGALSWNGGPQSIDYPTLSGNLQLKAEKGQFTELQPGIAANLLGILSLQALPRRATLDFHDMFSKGFSFDDIESNLVLKNGVIATDKLTISGPLAEIKMAGQVNIVEETQQLNMEMTPSYADSLALAGLLIANPIIGATAFLVQKAFKDPLGHLITYEYNITGTWSKPVVTNLTSSAPSPQKDLWRNP